jgi:hypothetical protein
MINDTINVYWSPQATWEVESQGEWNMLYPDPTNLFTELNNLRTSDAGTRTYFSCSATGPRFKNTFVFRNELSSSYAFDFSKGFEKSTIYPLTQNFLNFEIKRPPSITTGPLVNINLFYSFFAEESLEAEFTPPMMHPPQYTKYGTCIPGSFDIGQWFRPYPLELQMWNMKGELHLNQNEPLFYVHFNTDKKVNLQRFKMNGTISSYLDACSGTAKVWGMGSTLQERYDRFKRTRMKDLILKEIKQNLLD